MIEKEIGEGSGCVYVYYNKNDKELAELKGKDVWECKIGMSMRTAEERILEQKSTAYNPVIALVIKTDIPMVIESQIHQKFQGCRVGDNTDEWFMTRPEIVEQAYRGLPGDGEKISLRDIGKIVARKRKTIGWTQSELGRLSGLPQKTVSRLENGTDVNVSSLYKVLDALNVRFYITEQEYTKAAIP